MSSNSRFSYIFVAISFVSTALLYVYFKNKVDKVDEKLDMMYQLIQSHAIDTNELKNEAPGMRYSMSPTMNFMGEVNNNAGHNNEGLLKTNEEENLIQVSENETDANSSSDESDSDSEESEHEQLSVGSDAEHEIDDIKRIELTLDQEEKDEISEEVHLKKMEVMEVNLEEMDGEETHVSEEENKENANENQQEEDEEMLEEKDDEMLEEKDDDVEVNEVDYNQFKVTELKSFCRDKKLTNYASLKKAQLIDLLMSS